MSDLKAEDHERRQETLEGWDITITSYRIGDKHYCHIDNVSPGATIARSEGETRQEAEKIALAKAGERLAKTKKNS